MSGFFAVLLACWCCRYCKATKEVTLRYETNKAFTPFGPAEPESPSVIKGGIDYKESRKRAFGNNDSENQIEEELRKTRLKVALKKEKLRLQELEGMDPENEGQPGGGGIARADSLEGGGGTAGGHNLRPPILDPDIVSASDELEFITPRGQGGPNPISLDRLPVHSMTRGDEDSGGEEGGEVYATDSDDENVPRPMRPVKHSDSLFQGNRTGGTRLRIGEGGGRSSRGSSAEDKRSSGSSKGSSKTKDEAAAAGLLTPPENALV